jgi:hypothetical protein
MPDAMTHVPFNLACFYKSPNPSEIAAIATNKALTPTKLIMINPTTACISSLVRISACYHRFLKRLNSVVRSSQRRGLPLERNRHLAANVAGAIKEAPVLPWPQFCTFFN